MSRETLRIAQLLAKLASPSTTEAEVASMFDIPPSEEEQTIGLARACYETFVQSSVGPDLKPQPAWDDLPQATRDGFVTTVRQKILPRARPFEARVSSLTLDMMARRAAFMAEAHDAAVAERRARIRALARRAGRGAICDGRSGPPPVRLPCALRDQDRPTRTHRHQPAPMTTTTTKRSVSPLGDRVCVRETPPEDRTKGGIVLPPSAQRARMRTGVVVALGDGVTSKAFKAGDTVVIAEYAGTEIALDDEKLLIVTTAELVAKIG